MKRKQAAKDQPERRRALAEINLIGQKGSGAKAVKKRGGCAQIFGVLSLLAGSALWLALTIGPR